MNKLINALINHCHMKKDYYIFDLIICIISLLLCIHMLVYDINKVITTNADPKGVYIFGFLTITTLIHVIIRAKNLKE